MTSSFKLCFLLLFITITLVDAKRSRLNAKCNKRPKNPGKDCEHPDSLLMDAFVHDKVTGVCYKIQVCFENEQWMSHYFLTKKECDRGQFNCHIIMTLIKVTLCSMWRK